jgi:hypothetical protein
MDTSRGSSKRQSGLRGWSGRSTRLLAADEAGRWMGLVKPSQR